MDTTASNRRLRILLTGISKGSLVPRPEFQRRLVWSNSDKVAFIRTVIDGFPFPEIYIAAGSVDAKTGEGSEMLVDGQQRITTLYQYFKDSPDIKLPKDLPKYQDLKEADQLKFLEYSVVIRDLGNMNIEEIKTIFQRINSTSYGLNAMEIHNSRYAGEFKVFGEKLAERKFFEDHKFFSRTEIHRMKDVLYCLGITATIMSSYFNRDSEIEDFLEKYNEVFAEKDIINAGLDEVFKFIERLNFDNNSRIYKKGDLFTIIIELYRLIVADKVLLDPAFVRKKLDLFYTEVENAANPDYEGPKNSDAEKYYKASLQAINDRGSRITRGEIIKSILSQS